MSQVQLRGVRKEFGKTVALDDFNLTIPEGSLVTLLGPSGCGKTTALRIIAGLIKADRGHTFFDSTEMTDTSASARDIGMVFQAYSLFPNMTARENIEFGLRVRKDGATSIRAKSAEILGITGLEQHQDKYPHQMSGGQQQRVALARAIVFRPKVLLLDEPLSALDAQVRDQLRDEIRRVQREFGITTLFVTHDQEEAMSISDQVGVMSKGSLLQLGTPESVYSQPVNPTVARFIGTTNEIPVQVASHKAHLFDSQYEISPASVYSPSSIKRIALVRPEEIKLNKTSDDSGNARILAISFLGPTSTLELTLAQGLLVKATMSSKEASTFAINESVGVVVTSPSLLITDR